MALAAQVSQLRGMLGEVIPSGGTEADTLFTDIRIGEMVDEANGDLERAAYDAWREKAGMLANLVTVTEGAASREMSELHGKALEMVKLYAKASTGPTEGRARVGRIVRR